jgi:hypothetical protein
LSASFLPAAKHAAGRVVAAPHACEIGSAEWFFTDFTNRCLRNVTVAGYS